MNSPPWQLCTHVPLSQTKPRRADVALVGLAVAVVVEAVARLRRAGCESCWQMVPVAVHWVMPGPQMPGLPVSQGWPPPAQVMPVRKKTSSLKSPSLFQAEALVPPSSKAM